MNRFSHNPLNFASTGDLHNDEANEITFSQLPFDKQVVWFEKAVFAPAIHNCNWYRRLYLGMPLEYPLGLYKPTHRTRVFREKYIALRYDKQGKWIGPTKKLMGCIVPCSETDKDRQNNLPQP